MRTAQLGDDLRCSFCSKPQKEVGKLISSPSDHPRAYICSECIAVCASILDDDVAEEPPEPDPAERHALLDHPLASELMECLALWIRTESLGGEASAELARLRGTARRMMAHEASGAPDRRFTR